jgi:exodeoxyribonuclease V alpha subunit
MHVLRESLNEGHTFLPRTELEERARDLLEVSEEIVARAVDGIVHRDEIVVEGAEPAGEAVYLTTLHLCEVRAAERLLRLEAAAPSPAPIDVDRAVAWLEATERLRLGREQVRALVEAVRAKVVVITGGPGTGKTTLVNALVRVFERKVRRLQLCAPTGRAAKRLHEATGREAKTIHRLLEFNPSTMTFTRCEEHPLDADIVIVDEVSMVDLLVFCSTLVALPDACRLILVGDVDQLPSVGPGNVLSDVIESGVIPVVRLTEIYRQERESLIVLNAHRINDGEMPRIRPEGETGDFYFHECDDPEDALAVIKKLVADRIPRRFGFRAPQDIQVLTPMHKGVLGSQRLNEELQELLNPGDGLFRGSRQFRVGDKVMQIQNSYERDVFNGDIGWVSGWDDERREVTVRFDGRDVTYDVNDLDELVLAYACSIHKSQGNEFPAVVIPLHTQHYVMLRRNLLYTAITRGKHLVVVVGSRRALAVAVRNRQERGRHSRLAERLRAGKEKLLR